MRACLAFLKNFNLSWSLRAILPLLALGLGGPVFAAADSAQIAKGKYLVEIGGCASCHTAPGGKPFAGGLYINTPYGALPSPNITPDTETGIGAWSDDDFYRAMHDGIGKKGEYLYPVMPFPWYTRLARDDVLAIKSYLMSLPATHRELSPNKLSFPFSVRESLLAWRTVFFKAEEFKPDPAQSAEVNRGAYLVNGLAHCGECHNARPVAGQSKYRKAFQGGVIDDWYAPNITSDVHDGIGGWTNPQLVTYLKTGVAPGKGVALGPMAETVQNLSHMKTEDLQAIAVYLKSTPATPDKPADHEKFALYEGRDARGSQTYLAYCASCHAVNEKGLTNAVPALQGNGAVTAEGPQNVIRAILGGVEAQGNYAPMLAIGAAMSNEEVADVTNFVRQNGTNAAPVSATPGMVAKLREETDTPMNPAAKSACPTIADPALAKAISGGQYTTRFAGMTDAAMLKVAHDSVNRLTRAVPGANRAALVNALTAAYCPVVRKETGLDANAKALKLGHFSELVYMETVSRYYVPATASVR